MAHAPTNTARKTRTPRTEPRKTSLLLRVTDENGQPIDHSRVKVEVVMLGSDKRKLFDALQSDRSLISLEYVYPANEAPMQAPRMHETAE